MGKIEESRQKLKQRIIQGLDEKGISYTQVQDGEEAATLDQRFRIEFPLERGGSVTFRYSIAQTADWADSSGAVHSQVERDLEFKLDRLKSKFGSKD